MPQDAKGVLSPSQSLLDFNELGGPDRQLPFCGELQQGSPPGIGLGPQAMGTGLTLPGDFLGRGRQGLRRGCVTQQPEEFPVIGSRGHRPFQSR